MTESAGSFSIPTDVTAFERCLAQRLVERGQLTEQGVERAMRVRGGGNDGRLAHLLSMLGLVSERDVAQTLSELLQLPLVVARDFPTEPILEDRVSRLFLSEFRVLPLADDGECIVVAVADPLSRFAIDAIRLRLGRPILARVGIPSEIEGAIDRLYNRRHARRAAENEAAAADDAFEHDVERLKDLASEAPVIRIVNQLITKAVGSRASDIHLEPFEDALHVRYRVDGTLRDVQPPPNRYRAAIVSRIKIMARLNIAERRLPQDGRMKMAVRGTPIDFRVAITPTLHGESVVIRILDRSSVALDLASLGMDVTDLHSYLGILERPHGIMLVTGPTGSGKTTTLYASLLRLHTTEKKIVTIEDPIEYQLDGINQIQVKPNIGLDFANILRSVLRHDPDIIMVGEIRDAETAEVAVQAALTGHLVLSTLHTNNAASSITRLLDMGAQDFLLTSTLSGTVAQRLVRRLCRHCREAYVAMPELVLQLGLRRYSNAAEIELYRPKGCEECHGTGFFGRISIFEILVVTDAIRRLVLQRAGSHELQRVAVREGMRTMYDDGIIKAIAGITTIEEVLQVTRDVPVEAHGAGRELSLTSIRGESDAANDTERSRSGNSRGRSLRRRAVAAPLETEGGAPPPLARGASVEEILQTIEEAVFDTDHR